jgi:hypothetical protein
MVNTSITYDRSKTQIIEKCPSCKKEWTSRLRGQACYYACAGCNKLFEISSGRKVVNSDFKQLLIFPVLEIGNVGTFEGFDYEVVGIVLLKERKANYYWYEYTLFHPLGGYRILSHSEGHWNFFERTLEYPKITSSLAVKKVKFKENWYDVYTRYASLVVWAEGEFTYEITEEPRPIITEWICPPYALVRELGVSNITWFSGVYKEPYEVKKAFDLSKQLPPKKKVASNQPFSFGFDLLHFVSFSVVYVALLIISILLLSSLARTEEKVFKQSFYPEYDSTSTLFKPFITESFQIEPGLLNSTGLDLELSCGVDNSWFEAQVTLINDDTEEEYNIELGVEYYHGYTDGENWTEGSNQSSKFVSEMSPGKYHMVIIPYPDTSFPLNSFTIAAIRNPIIWSNFWWMLAVSLVFPIILYFYQNSFETNRWMNSEYSPYD